MESNAAEEPVRTGAEPTDIVEGLPTNQDNNTTSLPSPPTSVKATDLDSHRNADSSLSGEVAGSESSISAHGGAKGSILHTVALIEVQANRQTR